MLLSLRPKNYPNKRKRQRRALILQLALWLALDVAAVAAWILL